MDKMREEFDEFIAKEFQFSDQPRNDGSYRCTKINDLWKSWQASRAALCVELPSGWIGHPYRNDILSAVDEMSAELDRVGVEYK